MIKIIFENKKRPLLLEINIGQAEERFNSDQFIAAAERYRKENVRRSVEIHGAEPRHAEIFSPTKTTVILAIKGFIPKDISKRHEAEFLNWLISLFIKNSTYAWDRDISRYAEIFYQIKEQKLDRFLEKKNIYSMDAEDFVMVVEKAKVPYGKHLSKKEYKNAELGTNKIYEDDSWEIFIPEDKGSACKLGKNTEWCTAAHGLQYYEQYHKKDDPLIIFINKKDPTEKYQFHYGSSQFMDRDDRDIMESDRFSSLNNIIKRLKDKLPAGTILRAKKYEKEHLGNGVIKIRTPIGIKTYLLGILNSIDDEPGFIRDDGLKMWYKDGLIHRDNDKPAVVSPGKYESWYQNGKRHRENDQPAVIHKSGYQTWYVNDLFVKETKYKYL